MPKTASEPPALDIKPTLFDILLAAFSVACVAVVGLDRMGWLPGIELQGSMHLGLYPIYSFAAATGWLMGNLYVRRRARVRSGRWLLYLFYLLLPIGPFFLFRAMAPLEAQRVAPLVPWFCAGIIFVFFLVPVTLRPRTKPRRPRIGSKSAGPPDE